MDAERIATLLCSLATGSSRRGLVAGLASNLLAVLPLVLRGEDAAAKKNKRKRKKRKKTRCSPNCSDRTCGNDGCGGSCGSCAANQTCGGGVCVALPCGAGGSCRVFVTSTTYTGGLGVLAGADNKCKNRAVAAGLPGTFMAWLSDAFLAPATRFTQSTGPYQLVTGATVATNWSDLTDGTLAAAIQVNELGVTVGAPFEVWTNTKPDGTQETTVPAHCDNWTDATTPPPQGRYGLTPATTGAFTTAAIGDCTSARRLYCVQQS